MHQIVSVMLGWRGTAKSILNRCEKKFTLMEATVGMSVFALMAAGVIGSFTVAGQMIGASQEHQEAEMLVFDRLWSLYHEDYDDLVNSTVTAESIPAGSILFERGGVIRSAVYVYSDYCELEVRVDWNRRGWGDNATPAHEQLSMRRYNCEL